MKILIDRDELVRVFNSRRALYCDETPESFRKLDYSDKCRVDMLDSCISDAFNMPTYEAFCNKKSLSEELEKIKAEIRERANECQDYQTYINGLMYTYSIIDKYISELKGENK